MRQSYMEFADGVIVGTSVKKAETFLNLSIRLASPRGARRWTKPERSFPSLCAACGPPAGAWVDSKRRALGIRAENVSFPFGTGGRKTHVFRYKTRTLSLSALGSRSEV